MATNKERTSSAAMRKLLLQSASKKEQEIQQIRSVAERGERIGSGHRNRPRTSAGTNGKAGIQTFRAVFSKNRRKQSLRKKILGISGRAKIKEYRSNPDIQRNPQKAEADCYGHGIRNAQYRQQHS